MSDETRSTCYAPTHDRFGEDLPDLMPLATAPPLPHTCAAYSPTKQVESVYALRPRPPRPAVPDGHVRVHRKRVYAQQEDALQQPQPVPHKRGRTRGTPTDVCGTEAVAAALVCMDAVQAPTLGLQDVVVKEQTTFPPSILVPFRIAVDSGEGVGVGGGMAPTRDVAGVRMHEETVDVKKHVTIQVKEESSDGEDEDDYEDDEDVDIDGCGDTGGGGGGGGFDDVGVRIGSEWAPMREMKQDVDGGVEGGMSPVTGQLAVPQSHMVPRKRRNPWVSDTNPYGFKPATLTRLQELSPEAREKYMQKLLYKIGWSERQHNPALQQQFLVAKRLRRREYQMSNEQKEERARQRKAYAKEWRANNREKKKQQGLRYYEKNKEKVRQHRQEYREKNREQVNAYERERRARKKAEREAAERAAADAHGGNA